MSKRDKLLIKMRSTPGGILFREVVALLRYQGFTAKKKSGSHRTYQHSDGRVLAIVRPHGRHKTCHPDDVRRLLEVLGL